MTFLARFSSAWNAFLDPTKRTKALDYARFRSHYGFLHESPSTDPTKIILFVSLTENLVQVKMEGMFAKALQHAGYTPVILTNSTNKLALQYFRAFGLKDFLFFNQRMDAIPLAPLVERAERILQESSSFRALLEYTEHDIRIGNHVLSTAVRRLRKGSGGFHDPVVQELLHQLLPRCLQTAQAAKALFQEIHPAAILFLEKGYTPYGELFDAATLAGIPCVQYVHSHLSNQLVLKRYTLANRTLHPFSFSPSTWEKVKRMPWSKEEEQHFLADLKRSYEQGLWFNRRFLLEGKKMKSPDEVRAQLKLDPTKKTAVIFSHVLWDATFFFGKTLFDDYEQWLAETVQAACENKNVNWIIKIHPDYVWKMKQMGETGNPRDIDTLEAAVGKLPPHVQVVMPDTDISTYSFFAVIDYCITVRGTIGIEAPCFGIPVFTAGTGRYSGLGFTEDSETRQEYLQKILHIHEYPRLSLEKQSLALRHAYSLFTLRPLAFTSFRMKRAQAIGGTDNVEICVHSTKELTEAPDLHTFTQWLLHSSEEDYVSLPS